MISLSFANVKETEYKMARKKICQLMTNLYAKNTFLLNSGVLEERDIAYFKRVSDSMDDSDASMALYHLSDYLNRCYGKGLLFSWMNMIRLCRRLMWADIGRSW